MKKNLGLVGPEKVSSLYATADSHKELVLIGMIEQANYRLLGKKPSTEKEKYCRVNIIVFMPPVMTLDKQLKSIKKSFIARAKKSEWKDVEIKLMDYRLGEGSFEIDFYI